MKISMINGSPKPGKSNSGAIIKIIRERIKDKHEVKIHNLGTNKFKNEILEEIISTEVIILVFPLYLDSIPANTLKMLIELGDIIKLKHKNDLIMYSVVHNGFLEGKQTSIAFEMIENFCGRSGIQFGGGIGQGASSGFYGAINSIVFKCIYNNFFGSLESLIKKIDLKQPFGIRYLSPHIPGFLFRIIGAQAFALRARKYGLSKNDIMKGTIT